MTHKRYFIGLLIATGITACISENSPISVEPEKTKDKGEVELNVSMLEPNATGRATYAVTDFPVIITDEAGKTVEQYNRVSDVPSSITLSVGKYTVESHTPGTLAKSMPYPYYHGVESVDVLKGTTTQAEVTCKMQNSKINVSYSSDFVSVFSAWTITIDDGSETAITFSNTSTSNEIYWLFAEGTELITINFRGETKDGNVVTSRNTLSKSQASEAYDDGIAHFTGGDAIALNFVPVESTEGKISGISINVNILFTETNEDITLEIGDKEDFKDEGGSSDTPPAPDNKKITLQLPQPISFPFLGAESVDKSKGDTYIAAETGLKSIKVKIESTSNDMMNSLGDLKDQYGVDFIAGAEIVDNQSMVQLFTSLNQPLSVPSEGDKEYTFPIGNFFGFLQVLAGEHTFLLTVIDMNGEKKSGTVKITIQ